MPYIPNNLREELNENGLDATLPGELNYLITLLIKGYLDINGTSCTIINDIVGSLECAKQEFVRRVVVPYMEQKRFETGDIYDNQQ